MAVAIPFIVVAGAAFSAVAAVRQGQAAKAAANYNAQIAEQNAGLAREEAQMLVRQQDRETYMRLGAVRAAQGKSGGAAGEGSVLDILGDVAAQSELERQQIIYRGELKARGLESTATLDRFSGRQAQQSGYLKAGSELLSGAAGAYGAGTRLTRT